MEYFDNNKSRNFDNLFCYIAKCNLASPYLLIDNVDVPLAVE